MMKGWIWAALAAGLPFWGLSAKAQGNLQAVNAATVASNVTVYAKMGGQLIQQATERDVFVLGISVPRQDGYSILHTSPPLIRQRSATGMVVSALLEGQTGNRVRLHVHVYGRCASDGGVVGFESNTAWAAHLTDQHPYRVEYRLPTMVIEETFRVRPAVLDTTLGAPVRFDRVPASVRAALAPPKTLPRMGVGAREWSVSLG